MLDIGLFKDKQIEPLTQDYFVQKDSFPTPVGLVTNRNPRKAAETYPSPATLPPINSKR